MRTDQTAGARLDRNGDSVLSNYWTEALRSLVTTSLKFVESCKSLSIIGFGDDTFLVIRDIRRLDGAVWWQLRIGQLSMAWPRAETAMALANSELRPVCGLGR